MSVISQKFLVAYYTKVRQVDANGYITVRKIENWLSRKVKMKPFYAANDRRLVKNLLTGQ